MLWSYGEALSFSVFVLRRAIASRVSMNEMHPYLMVAASIFFTKTQRAVGDGERTMQASLPHILGVRRLVKPDTSTHSPGILPSIAAAWAAANGTVEVTSNQVHGSRRNDAREMTPCKTHPGKMPNCAGLSKTLVCPKI